MTLFQHKKVSLQYILFEVTQQCNLSCLYCYNHWKRDGNNNILKSSYEQSIKTLRKLFKTASVKHVTFTGGEPLLTKRIQELVLFCRMKGSTVSVITNGNTGSQEDFSHLINIGVQVFELPLHSPTPAGHDHMTGKEGSWQNSLNTMHFLTQKEGTVVPVIVVTKINYNKVGETLMFLQSNGFSRIMLNWYNIGGPGLRFPEIIVPTSEELNEAFFQANEMVKKLGLVISSNVCTPHCVVDPLKYRHITFTNCSTNLMQRPLTLTATGDMRFCNHSPTVLGNIFKTSVNQILDEGSDFEIMNNTPEFCAGCSRYDKCLGGCRAAAEQAGKTFFDVDPLALNFDVKNHIKSA